MATLKLEKKTAFPFFILHECGDGVRRVAEKVSRDVIGVTAVSYTHLTLPTTPYV